MSHKEYILGQKNPEPFGDEVISLYTCEGKTHSIREFTRCNLHLLNQNEQNIIAQCLEHLPDEEHIPPPLRRCLTRSIELRANGLPAFSAQRSGARSAYWEERKIKFKGCRPVLEQKEYPMEILPFREEKIQYLKIPFGVLRKESVMREILAYCFFRSRGLNPQSSPICVYEYHHEESNAGYCLVMESRGENRAEALIEYPDLSLGDVITADAGDTAGYNTTIGSELNLSGLNLWWYAEQKSSLLSDMHFNGGFRGILNSNIGNDVIALDGDAPLKLYLCDFDTFWMLDIPDAPSDDFLKHFALQCLIETIKGSISIFEYVDFPDSLDAATRAEILAEIYFQKSSVWRAYERRFYRIAKKRGWDPKRVEKAVKEAVRTEAFADIVGGCVLNSHQIGEMSKNRGVFYPHN